MIIALVSIHFDHSLNALKYTHERPNVCLSVCLPSGRPCAQCVIDMQAFTCTDMNMLLSISTYVK